MRESKTITEYVFDEKQIAKNFLELPEEKDQKLGRSVRSGVLSNWEQSYFPILRLALRYMIREWNVQPAEAETLIYKYVAFVGYLFQRNKEIKKIAKGESSDFVFVKEFDEQAKGVITLGFLRSKVGEYDSPYAMNFNLGKCHLFVKSESKNQAYFKGLSEKACNKFINGIPFFSDGTNIMEFAESGLGNSRFDIMAAEANNSPSWTSFRFALDEDKSNIEAFENNLSESGRSVSLLFIPFIIDEILSNWKNYSRSNGKQIKFNFEVELRDVGYYKDVIYSSHGSFEELSFMDDGHCISWARIKPFKFVFEKDGRTDTYTFSQSGLIRQ